MCAAHETACPPLRATPRPNGLLSPCRADELARGAPLRVRLFTDTLADVNGVSRFVLDMLRLAHQQGHDFSVVTSTRRDLAPALTRVQVGGAGAADGSIINLPPLWSRPMPGYDKLDLVVPRAGSVRRIMQSERPDVIHVSTPGPVGIAAWLAARARGIPVVSTYHTDFPAYADNLFADEALTWSMRWAVRTFCRRCDLVLTRSAAYARVVKDLGVHCSRIKALRPGTDTSVFNPRHADPAAWAAPGGASDEPYAPVRVLYVGRVSVEKNLPMLVSVWRRVLASPAMSGVRAELVVVGDGPYLPTMRAALAGLPARFMGFRSGVELSRLYASSDLFVFPSVTDTLGQGVLEAQASGLPAIVSDVGGPREIVRDGRTGLVLSSRDVGAWANAVARLVVDVAARQALAQSARAHAEEHSIERSFQHFWRLHVEVASSMRPA